MVATLDGLKSSFGGHVSGLLDLKDQAGTDQRKAVELMDQLKNSQQVK